MNASTLLATNHLAKTFLKPAQSNTKPTEYLLGKSASEPDRLVRQAELYRPESQQLLDAVNLTLGQRALDLGCGPLGVLDEMAERVGPTGVVIGLERESSYRAHAEARLREHKFSNTKVLGGDARQTQLPKDCLDLAHARLLLVNVPRPQEIVNEMARVTKPGGAVALHEVDWVSWVCEPMVASWERMKNAAKTIWTQNGLDVHIGRRLPSMLTNAGLTDIHIQTRSYAWRAGDLKQNFLLAIIERIRTDIVTRGLLSFDEVTRFEQELKAHLSDPNTVVLSPTYIQAWARKPTHN